MPLKALLYCPSHRPYGTAIDGNFVIGSDVLLIERLISVFACPVLFFPHHESPPSYFEILKEALNGDPRLELAAVDGLADAFSRADAVVTDMRRIVFAFAMMTLKPAVFYSPYRIPVDAQNDLRLIVGRVAGSLDDVVRALRELTDAPSMTREQISVYRDENIFNLKFSLG